MNLYLFIEFASSSSRSGGGDMFSTLTEWWTMTTLSRSFAAKMYHDATLLLRNVLIPLATEEKTVPLWNRMRFLQDARCFVFGLHMMNRMALRSDSCKQVESAFDNFVRILKCSESALC